jgi:serine/threonine-protein kinase HipA
MIEASHGVFLGSSRVGTLLQRGDVARFVFVEGYWDDPDRPVLGAWFEDDPRRSPQAALRLPPWFSNLLPEGPLRTWIARDQGVNVERELQLLLRIGDDLPGAVRVIDLGREEFPADLLNSVAEGRPLNRTPYKFSLAGVGLKFSMLRQGDRLTVPSSGTLGNWIVKFPDAVHPRVPENEFETMSMARSVGIEVPSIKLVHRDELPGVPAVMWPNKEEWSFSIERFDRPGGASRIHIEDFAQVRGFYPDEKYNGSLETVVSLAYRGHDLRSFEEAIRRVVFNLLVGNGDAHLKNWSLIYSDTKSASLSPAYDLVSTAGYYGPEAPEDLGLKFGGTRRFERVGRAQFERLGSILGIPQRAVFDVVEETIERFRHEWSSNSHDRLSAAAREWIDDNLDATCLRISRRG